MTLMESDVEALLYRVRVDLGLCLDPESYDQLVIHAPGDVDAMTDAIFAADGVNPATADRALYGRVRAYVAEAFEPRDPRKEPR
jgi:hypothetical protein